VATPYAAVKAYLTHDLMRVKMFLNESLFDRKIQDAIL
jgi:hypothetical protein